MIAMTTRSSMRVNPRFVFSLRIFSLPGTEQHVGSSAGTRRSADATGRRLRLPRGADDLERIG